jgi:hypothetical protein
MKMTKPQLWHLNSSWSEHDLSATFIEKGFWEIDPSRLSDTVSRNRIKRIKCGTVVRLVSYSRNVCMTIEASGVVTGINYKRMKLSVTWQKQKDLLREYHSGTARPITGPFVIKAVK